MIAQPRAGYEHARKLRVFLPAGMVECSQEHVAVLSLFGSERAQAMFGFSLERAPWVPSCLLLTRHCYAHGGLPPHLRGRVTLLNNFGIGPFRLAPAEHVRFRDAVHAALGLGSGPPRSILYVRSSRWPTKRTVLNEEGVVAALAKWAAAEHPSLRFSASHVHELSYADEVAAFADARVLISLWGSSLHNCRYMRPGSLVVELFGALDSKYGDTTIYSQACSDSAGLLHAPYGVPGAYPKGFEGKSEEPPNPEKFSRRKPRRGPGAIAAAQLRPMTWRYDQPTDETKARVDPDHLVGFMRRVFPTDPCVLPDWLSVFVQYNAFLAAQPNPRTQRPLGSLGHAYTQLPLPRQYRTPPWCPPNDTAAGKSAAKANRRRAFKDRAQLAMGALLARVGHSHVSPR